MSGRGSAPMVRATATLRLLRAIASLGPRLHEPHAATSPEALYALVCDTLRACDLQAHIAVIANDGVPHIIAHSLDADMLGAIEGMLGVPFVGYPLVSPVYADTLSSGEAVEVEDVAAILDALVPHLTAEQRPELARQAGAERALLAPLVPGGETSGILSVWGPRDRFSRDDIPALAALAAQVGIALENGRLLRQSDEEHARWRATVDSMGEMVVTCDPAGRITYLNPAADRILGALGVAMPADGYPPVALFFHADGTPYTRDELPVEVARRTGQPAQDTIVVIRTTNDEPDRHTLWSASPVRLPDGTLLGAVATGRDVTGQRLLEAMNRAALDVLLRIAGIVTEPADTYSLLERLAEALSGLAAVEQTHATLVQGVRPIPIAIFGVPPDVEEAWRAALGAWDPEPEVAEGLRERFLAGHIFHQDFSHNETVISAVAATRIHVRASITAPVLVGGDLVGLLTIARARRPAPDVAEIFMPWDVLLLAGVARLAGEAIERRRLTEQLLATEAARQAAEAATRQRDEFLGVASHELRTPLTTIRMNVQLAERRLSETGDERALELLRRTERQVLRMTHFIEDLVDTARIVAGRLELRADHFDLCASVADAVEEQRQGAARGRIRLELPACAVAVRGDTVRVGQVVTNYLLNALRYSPEGAPVEVSLSMGGRVARLTVRDRGPGLPVEEQALIWERFHQAKDVRVQTGSGVGLGLGLYISRTIIERHGGRVGVASAPGEGAAFWFELPVADGPDGGAE